MGVAAADDAGVGPRDPLEVDGRVELPVEALRSASPARRGRRGRIVVADASAAARPAAAGASRAARRRARRAPTRRRRGSCPGRRRQPRERGRVVEVGDGDVGVALDDRRAARLHLAERVDRGRRAPARSARGRRRRARRRACSFLSAFRHRLERGRRCRGRRDRTAMRALIGARLRAG